MAHVKFCTPFYSDYDDAYKTSLLELSKAKTPWTWEHQACQGVNPALARNMLINQGKTTCIHQELDKRISHYLFVDADVSFYADNVTWLVDRNVDIISGAYKARGAEGCYQAGMWEGMPGNIGQYVSTASRGVVEVDWVGAGFLLVKREVLERMEYPWFRHEMVRAVMPSKAVMDTVEYHAVEVEEDIGFSLNAKAHGFRILLDCEVRASHQLDGDRCREIHGKPPMQITPVATHFSMPNTTLPYRDAIIAGMTPPGGTGCQG